MDYTPSQVEHVPEAEEKKGAILEGEIVSFPGNVTIVEYFQNALTTNRIEPNSVAIIDEDRKLTFDDLDTMSTLLAMVLRRAVGPEVVNGNPDGDWVFGVCIPPSNKLVLLLFAIMKLDAAYVPIDISFPEDRIQRVVDVARPVIIITDTKETATVKFSHVQDKSKIVTLQDIWSKYELLKRSSTMSTYEIESLPTTLPKPQLTAIVLFTSGSSGAPKGVRLSHRTIMNRLSWQWKEFPFARNEVSCFKTALTFVDSVPEIFGTLLQGLPLVVIPKSIVTQSHLFVQEIKKHGVTRLTVVPSFLESVLTLMEISEDGGGSERAALESLNFWICSGETLSYQLLLKFFKHFPQGKTLCNFYGSTEIMGDVTFDDFNSIEDVNRKCVKLPDLDSLQVPLGRAIYNSLVYILDNDLKITAEGGMGEVCIAGYNLATGYVGIRESDKFIVNPHVTGTGYNILYRTGDYGQIQTVPGGSRVLIFNGRVDSQIKIRGHRVDLSEVEAAVKSSSLVGEGVVLCYNAGQVDQAIVAFVVPKDTTSLGSINASIKSKLLAYQVPVVRVISKIPRLVNGKIDRQLLLQKYREEMRNRGRFDNWDGIGIAAEELKQFKVLVETISEVTGTPINIIVSDLDASFFDLGGTSLNSLTVIAMLRKEKIVIPITEFVSAKSIRELGVLVQNRDHQNGEEIGNITTVANKKLKSELLSDEHKDEVIHLISSSFSNKGDLEPLVGAEYSDFPPLLESSWPYLVKAKYSFVIRRIEDNFIVAASLNFDADEEPQDLTVPLRLTSIFEFLEDAESAQRHKIPHGKGVLLHNFMMGTHEGLSNAENVFVIQFMEEENIRLGKSNRFHALLTTNTSLLTQSIAKEVLGYETLSEIRVKDWIDSKGKKPFAKAPDTQTAQVCWKDLRL